MAWVVECKCPTRPVENTSPFVYLRFTCRSLGDAQDLAEDRKDVYYDIKILEVNALVISGSLSKL